MPVTRRYPGFRSWFGSGSFAQMAAGEVLWATPSGVSQPLVGRLPSQSPYPARQVKEQEPAVQARAALAALGQIVPQPLQLSGSDERSTQPVPQKVWPTGQHWPTVTLTGSSAWNDCPVFSFPVTTARWLWVVSDISDGRACATRSGYPSPSWSPEERPTGTASATRRVWVSICETL